MIILCNTFSERDLAQDDVVALQDAKILLTTHVSELEQELKRYLLHVLVSCLNLLMVSKIGLFYCFCLIFRVKMDAEKATVALKEVKHVCLF